jgi:hypothetical protein
LTEHPGLKALDDKLRGAQTELDSGNSADAITDAGTALQLLLSHLGHHGKTLGEQVKAARLAGLFSGIDGKLGAAVDNLCDWVASVRNQRGDAHPAAQPDRADAELVFRIVVTLVLRLA